MNPAYSIYQQPIAGQQAGQQGQIDQATMDAVLALNQQQAKQSAINRQLKLADQLRADAGGQLQGMQVGRRYVAPGAANMIANLAGNVYGAQQMDTAGTAQAALGVEQEKASRAYMEALKRRSAGSLMGGGMTGGTGSYSGGYGSEF